MRTLSLIALSVFVSSAAQADTASITGKVEFEGTPPRARILKTDADPQCHAMHQDTPLRSEEVVVNDNGTLRNVFVYIKSGVTKKFDKPSEPVVLDQLGCQYKPHVMGMQVGQLLLIKNSDDTTHNVHATPTQPGNREFNAGQPAGAADLRRTFTAPEVMIRFKCDLHPWMSAYVGVLEHPFFSVTGEEGTFSIKNLPAGDYELVAWHEKYGEQSAKLKVGDGEAKTQNFKFAKSE